MLNTTDSVLLGCEVTHDACVHQRSGSFSMAKYNVSLGLFDKSFSVEKPYFVGK